MDGKLAALEKAYDDANRSQASLRQHLADLRIIGTEALHVAAFRAVAEGDAALDAAARALAKYRGSRHDR